MPNKIQIYFTDYNEINPKQSYFYIKTQHAAFMKVGGGWSNTRRRVVKFLYFYFMTYFILCYFIGAFNPLLMIPYAYNTGLLGVGTVERSQFFLVLTIYGFIAYFPCTILTNWTEKIFE